MPVGCRRGMSNTRQLRHLVTISHTVPTCRLSQRHSATRHVLVRFEAELEYLSSRSHDLHDLHDTFNYGTYYYLYSRNRGHAGTWKHADKCIKIFLHCSVPWFSRSADHFTSTMVPHASFNTFMNFSMPVLLPYIAISWYIALIDT
jgi:hypothetical protein